jgi:hypothetical protein
MGEMGGVDVAAVAAVVVAAFEMGEVEMVLMLLLLQQLLALQPHCIVIVFSLNKKVVSAYLGCATRTSDLASRLISSCPLSLPYPRACYELLLSSSMHFKLGSRCACGYLLVSKETSAIRVVRARCSCIQRHHFLNT